MKKFNFRKQFSLNGITLIVFFLSLPLGFFVFSIFFKFLMRIPGDGTLGYIGILLFIPIFVINSILFTLLSRKTYQGSKAARFILLTLIALITVFYILQLVNK